MRNLDTVQAESENRNWINHFSFMKETDSLDALAAKSLPLMSAVDVTMGYLQPLTWRFLEDSTTVENLMSWRKAHIYAYPSRSEISEMSTATWLKKSVLGNPSRILFLVVDSFLRPVGHLGLVIDDSGQLELDNVLRGESGHPGLMTLAMQALERWCLTELDSQKLRLRVLESNARAVSFYERLDYIIAESESLSWVRDETGEFLRPSVGLQDDAFLVMTKNLQLAQKSEDKILTAGPLIGVREATYVMDAVQNGWNERHSEYLNEFESAFAAYIGTASALATSSCTGAMHLGLLALGVGPGDEVIVPETTWVATASAVRYVGATPVFADIDPVTWTITAETVRAVMTKKTKAIMPVHLYGYPADMPKLMSLANECGLLVLEDAAPAIGALVQGKAVGSFGDMAAFSFQGAKMLVTGEGGMLVTSDAALRDRAWKQQDHGRVPGSFWIDELGRKYKMSNVTAALGLAQLHSVETQISKKRRINRWYGELLSDTPGLSFQEELSNSRSICWMTSILIDESLDRSALASHLQSQGIDTRPVFPPISTYPIWDQKSMAPGPVASRVGAKGLNLPSGVHLSKASVTRVAELIDRAVRHGV